MKSSTHEITTGRHRGISFEINHPYDSYKFTYYIYLDLSRFENQELAESLWIEGKTLKTVGTARKYYDYYKNDFLSNLTFHGGITWYSKMFSGNDDRIIKIGCDYAHSFDEERYRWGDGYNLNEVLREVIETITHVHEAEVYLQYCSGDGRLVNESDGKYGKGEDFWSNAYVAEKEVIREGESQ